MTEVKNTLNAVNTPSDFRETVRLMDPVVPTVWMQPAQAQAGCGACHSADSGPRCRSHVTGEACAHPQLHGRQDLIAQVLLGLNRDVIDPDAHLGIVDLQWVQALRIADGEAELTLSFAPVCGPAKELAESAFLTLRRLLPDTDVYVRHLR